MSLEFDEEKEVSETTDTSKRIWIVIVVIILVMTGLLFTQESKKTAKPVGVHVKHLLIAVVDGNPASREEGLIKIKDIKRQLDEGADFSKLVTQYSNDKASINSGGDLGWLLKDETTIGFEEYIWKGPIGVYSDPVESNFGFHIIYIVDRNLSDAEEYQLEINQRLKDQNKPTE